MYSKETIQKEINQIIHDVYNSVVSGKEHLINIKSYIAHFTKARKKDKNFSENLFNSFKQCVSDLKENVKDININVLEKCSEYYVQIFHNELTKESLYDIFQSVLMQTNQNENIVKSKRRRKFQPNPNINKEVEEFKMKLSQDSKNAKEVIKIKPPFLKKWNINNFNI